MNESNKAETNSQIEKTSVGRWKEGQNKGRYLEGIKYYV